MPRMHQHGATNQRKGGPADPGNARDAPTEHVQQKYPSVDVGGAWCWTSSHHEVPALAQRLGVTSFPQHDDGINVVDYGNSITRTPQPFDSAKVRFEGGAAAIANALASHARTKGVNVQLDCTVEHISTAHDDAVRLDGVQAGDKKSWRAGAVFLAIPPRLALPPVMTWEPSMPPHLAKAAQATPTWMAQTTKVLITYPRPFWREQGMSGNALSSGGGPIQQLYDSSGPDGGEGPHALCGFVFGIGGREPPVDDILRLQVLEQLTRMFGAEGGSPLTFSSHRWSEQPLTSGNGGAAGGGHDSMGRAELRVPFGSATSGGHPRVWLSAAETDRDHAGLMEGAFNAGKRVAEEAIRSGVFRSQHTEAKENTCATGENKMP